MLVHRRKRNSLWSDHFATHLTLENETSTMYSSVRPILSSMLCCVIAFGHTPAWMHVATCDGDCKVLDAAIVQARSVCSHGCDHHVVAHESTDNSADSPSSAPAEDHDSDTCVICQSLANSCGPVSLDLQLLAPEYACEPAYELATPLPIDASIAIAQPRGPPAAA
ncbi:hypothetical protein CA51_24850 [Rosistilla oblonga]|nr:hypothetical protein CA51_24850 [Rosistilla oblonga]